MYHVRPQERQPPAAVSCQGHRDACQRSYSLMLFGSPWHFAYDYSIGWGTRCSRPSCLFGPCVSSLRQRGGGRWEALLTFTGFSFCSGVGSEAWAVVLLFQMYLQMAFICSVAFWKMNWSTLEWIFLEMHTYLVCFLMWNKWGTLVLTRESALLSFSMFWAKCLGLKPPSWQDGLMIAFWLLTLAAPLMLLETALKIKEEK